MIKDTYLTNLEQTYRIDLAKILQTAIRELLQHVKCKFRNNSIYIKFRLVTGCSKSLQIIINASKYISSLVNPDIMPKAV